MGRDDLVSLLAAPLPDPGSLGSVAAFGDTANDAASRIAAAINAEPVLVRTRLAALLQASDPQQLAELLKLHEGEAGLSRLYRPELRRCPIPAW